MIWNLKKLWIYLQIGTIIVQNIRYVDIRQMSLKKLFSKAQKLKERFFISLIKRLDKLCNLFYNYSMRRGVEEVHMKTFITNHWKNILVIIGGIFILANVFGKIIAPKSLISDYIKYGKDLEKIPSNIAGQVSGSINMGTMPFDAGMVKLIVTLMALILGILLITSLAEGKSSAKKK